MTEWDKYAIEAVDKREEEARRRVEKGEDSVVSIMDQRLPCRHWEQRYNSNIEE